MKTATSAVLVYVVALGAAVALLGGSATAQPLPTIAESFETALEITDLTSNTTVNIVQFYDVPNSRVKIEEYEDNESEIHLLLFAEDKVITFNPDTWECSTGPMWNNVSFFYENNHLHSLCQLLGCSTAASFSYVGKTVQRGIDCNSWTGTVSEDGSTYDLTLSFAADNWHLEGLDYHNILVSARMIGTDSGGDPIDTIIEFVHFRPGTPDEAEFWYEPANCGDFPPNQPFPTLPNDFSVDVEIVIESINRSINVGEMYNYDLNMARLEFYSEGYTYVEIVDENTGKRYEYTDDLSNLHFNPDGYGWTCTTKELWEGSQLESQPGQLKTAQELFGLGHTAVYHGRREARGVPCDYWYMEYNETSTDWFGEPVVNEFEVYVHFAVPSWSARGVSEEWESRIPIQTHYRGVRHYDDRDEDVHVMVNYFNWVPGPAPAHYFYVDKDDCGDYPPFKAFPEVSNDFSAVVEITNRINATTFYLREYVDYTGNRARLDTHAPPMNWVVDIRDYNVQREYTITYPIDYNDEDDSTCEYHEIYPGSDFLESSESSSESDGTHEGHGHIKTAGDLLQIIDQMNVTYRGDSSVRGIDAEWWFATHSETYDFSAASSTSSTSRGSSSSNDIGAITVNYEIDWYFEAPGWRTTGEPLTHQPLLRLSVSGHTIVYDTASSVVDFELFDLDFHIIDMFPGRPDSWLFDVDPARCGFLPDQKPLPAMPADFYSAVEITGPTESINIFEAYDSDKERERYTVRDQAMKYTVINRYDLDLSFVITNDATCEVTDLNEEMPPVREIFEYDDLMNVEYHGVYDVRGIPCDKFVGQNNGADEDDWWWTDAAYYFVDPTWNMHGAEPGSVIPAKIMFWNATAQWEVTFVDYVAEPAPAYFFEPPPGVTCPGYESPYGATTDSGEEEEEEAESPRVPNMPGCGAASTIGIFSGILGGVVVGAAAMFCLHVRGAAQAPLPSSRPVGSGGASGVELSSRPAADSSSAPRRNRTDDWSDHSSSDEGRPVSSSKRGGSDARPAPKASETQA